MCVCFVVFMIVCIHVIRNFIVKLRIKIFTMMPRNTAKYGARIRICYIITGFYLSIPTARTSVRVATLNDSDAEILRLTSLEGVDHSMNTAHMRTVRHHARTHTSEYNNRDNAHLRSRKSMSGTEHSGASL